MRTNEKAGVCRKLSIRKKCTYLMRRPVITFTRFAILSSIAFVLIMAALLLIWLKDTVVTEFFRDNAQIITSSLLVPIILTFILNIVQRRNKMRIVPQYNWFISIFALIAILLFIVSIILAYSVMPSVSTATCYYSITFLCAGGTWSAFIILFLADRNFDKQRLCVDLALKLIECDINKFRNYLRKFIDILFQDKNVENSRYFDIVNDIFRLIIRKIKISKGDIEHIRYSRVVSIAYKLASCSIDINQGTNDADRNASPIEGLADITANAICYEWPNGLKLSAPNQALLQLVIELWTGFLYGAIRNTLVSENDIKMIYDRIIDEVNEKEDRLVRLYGHAERKERAATIFMLIRAGKNATSLFEAKFKGKIESESKNALEEKLDEDGQNYEGEASLMIPEFVKSALDINEVLRDKLGLFSEFIPSKQVNETYE